MTIPHSVLAQTLPSNPAAARTFTLDGRLYNSTNLSSPLLDTNVVINVKVLDPTGACVLYEENQVTSTYSTDGYFNIKVGSDIANMKRTGDDPGHAMAHVFQNRTLITGTNSGCAGYVPLSGDGRKVRITVAPSSGSAEVLSPDIEMDSVPMAIVAESVQGLDRSRMLEMGAGSLTQTNVDTVFSNANYTKLSALLGGTSGDYVRVSGTTGAAMPTYAGNPMTPAAGQVWLDTGTGQLKFHDGMSVQALTSGTMVGGITNINGLTGGTQVFANGTAGTAPAFNSSGTAHTLNIPMASTASVTAGLISKTEFDAFNAKLSPALNSGEFYVGNGSNVATAVSASGDVTMSNAGVFTLATSGVTAGSYPKVQVDSKGRVIAGFPLLAIDIPGLAASHITAGTLPVARGGTGTGATPSNGQLLIGNGTDYSVSTLTAGTGISISNAAGSITINAASSGGSVTSVSAGAGLEGGPITTTGTLSLATTGVSAAAYPKVTVDTYGRVLSGSTLAASDIPDLDATKITSGTIAKSRLPSDVVLDGGNTLSSGTLVIGTSSVHPVAFSMGGTRHFTIDQYGHAIFTSNNATGDEFWIQGNNDSVLRLTSASSVHSSLIAFGHNSGGDQGWVGFRGTGSLAPYNEADQTMTMVSLMDRLQFGSTTNVRMSLIDGNLGIGTTSPLAKLHVVGSILPGADASACNSTKYGAIRVNSNALEVCMASNTWSPLSTSGATGTVTSITAGTGLTGGTITTTGTLALATTGVTAAAYPKVTVDVYGRVVTGSTLAASDIPDLNAAKISSGTLDSARLPSNLITDGGNSTGAAVAIGTNDSQVLDFKTNNTTRVTLDTLGRVGIGTIPGSVLHAVGSGNTDFAIIRAENTYDNNATYASLQLRRSRSSASAGGAGMGTGIAIDAENNNNNSFSSIGSFFAAWETAPSSSRNSYISIGNRTADTFSEKVRITSAGSFGIGTSTPNSMLQVAGAVQPGDDAAACAAEKNGAIRFNGGNLEVCLSTTWTTLSTSAGNGTVTSIVAGTGLTGGTITTTGTLALATTGVTAAAYPKVTVDVYGRVVSGSTLAASDIPDLDAAKIMSGTIGSARLPANLILDGGNSTGATVVVGTNDNQQLQLETNNTTRLTVGTNGNVGIGTNTPAGILEVSLGGQSRLLIDAGDTIFTGSNLEARRSSSTIYSPSSTSVAYPGGMEWIVRNTNGTTDTAAMVRFSASNSSDRAYFGVVKTSVPHIPAIVIGQQTGNTAYEERMRIAASGYVGIGTTTPNSTLEVAGAVQPGDDAKVCSTEKNGAIRFNGGNLQVCLTTTWTTLSTSAGNGTVTSIVAGTGLTGGTITTTGTIALATTGIASGTYTKVTIDTFGRATAGSTLSATDIPNLDAAKITSGMFSTARLPSSIIYDGGNSTGAPVIIGTNDTQALRLETNNATHVTISSDGNVAVGPAPATEEKFSVVASRSSTGPSIASSGYLEVSGSSNQTFAHGISGTLGHIGSGTIQYALAGSFYASIENSTGSANYLAGVGGTAELYGNTSATTIVGGDFSVYTQNNAAPPNMFGSRSVVVKDAVPTNANAYGVYAEIEQQQSSANNMTNAYGVYSKVWGSGANSITNAYGLYVDDVSQATNQWGVYQAGTNDKNYFGGSVSIGTTAAVTKLQVAGAVLAGDDATCAAGKYGALRVNSNNLQVCLATNTWTTLSTSGGGGTPAGANTQVQFNSSGTFGASSGLIWDNTNGRLGIGTTTPNGTFEVQGGSAPANTAGSAIRMVAQSATGPAGGVGGHIYLYPGAGANGWFGGSVRVRSNDGEYGALAVTNNGTFNYTGSSGSSSGPNFVMLNENTWFSDSNSSFISMGVTNSNGINQKSYFGSVATAGAATYTSDFVFGRRTGASSYAETLRILGANGSVGIGTIAPNSMLQVVGAVQPGDDAAACAAAKNGAIRFNGGNLQVCLTTTWTTLSTSAGAGDIVNGGNSTGATVFIGTNDNQQLRLETNNIARLTVGTNGFVGIGTTSPTAPFVVDSGTGNNLVLRDNAIENHKDTGAGEIAISYFGYDGGSSQFRNFHVFDGKQNTVGFFDGANRRLGVATSAPRASLDVNGAIVSKPATSNATATVDFGTGNLQYTTSSCQAFVLHNMKDGGSYNFAVQGATSATCTFTAYSDAGTTALSVRMPPGHTATTASTHTMYSFLVMGSTVYVAWVPGL